MTLWWKSHVAAHLFFPDLDLHCFLKFFLLYRLRSMAYNHMDHVSVSAIIVDVVANVVHCVTPLFSNYSSGKGLLNTGHVRIWRSSTKFWLLFMAPFWLRFCHTFCFWSITFEGMYQFLSKFTEGLSIVKYRLSSYLEIIDKALTELWPFFG